uniref:Uncharacterized protein n=1 Tax=Lotus japonicus TaxID=34305 RepID=I3T071_LOTJA|nr:unknown [Lotus japonicus]
MKTTSEVCEKAINSYLVDPVIILHIRILAKIEMQILVLISVSIWMHLQVMSMCPGNKISGIHHIVIYHWCYCILPRSNSDNILLYVGKVFIGCNFPV